jgi:hypothetical protein
MFKLQPSPTFWAPVEIAPPGEEPAAVEVQFRWLKMADQVEYGRKFLRLTVESTKLNGEAQIKKIAAHMAEVVVDWRGFEKPYSLAALEEYVAAYGQVFFSPVLRAFRDGCEGAPRKN